jgi:hypothetical protein
MKHPVVHVLVLLCEFIKLCLNLNVNFDVEAVLSGTATAYSNGGEWRLCEKGAAANITTY